MEDRSLEKIFARAAHQTPDLPTWVHENVGAVKDLKQKVLDRTYLEFLDEQIKLEARGPEWSRVLQKRRAALDGYCGKNLLSGTVSLGNQFCFIKIDLKSGKTLYWELDDVQT